MATHEQLKAEYIEALKEEERAWAKVVEADPAEADLIREYGCVTKAGTNDALTEAIRAYNKASIAASIKFKEMEEAGQIEAGYLE